MNRPKWKQQTLYIFLLMGLFTSGCRNNNNIKVLEMSNGDVVTIEIGVFEIEAPVLTQSEKLEINMMSQQEKKQEQLRRFENYLSSNNDKVKIHTDIDTIDLTCDSESRVVINTEKSVEMKGELFEEALESQRTAEKISLVEWNEKYKDKITATWEKNHQTLVKKDPKKMTVGKYISAALGKSSIDVVYRNKWLSGWDNSVRRPSIMYVIFFNNSAANNMPSPPPIIEEFSVSGIGHHPQIMNKWQFLSYSEGVSGTGTKGKLTYKSDISAIAYRIVYVKTK